jgi:hypothetical protein
MIRDSVLFVRTVENEGVRGEGVAEARGMGMIGATIDWACGGSAPARLAMSSRLLRGIFRQCRCLYWRFACVCRFCWLFAAVAASLFSRGSRCVVKGDCIDGDRGCQRHPQSFGSGFAWWYSVRRAWGVLVVIVEDERSPRCFTKWNECSWAWLVIAITWGV